VSNKEDTPSFLSQHEAVLSRLDYWQEKDGFKHFYPKEEFEKALPTFLGNPIIYARKHPPAGVRGQNLEEVLKELDGRVAGYNGQTLVNNMGSSKLFSTLNITDPEVDRKIRNGEISISSAFWYSAPQNGYLSHISGDHVLLYDKSSGVPQGDLGAMIVNQNETNIGSDTGSQNETETAYYGYVAGQFAEISGATMTEEKQEVNPYAELLKKNQETLVENRELILKLNQELKEEKEAVLKLNQSVEGKDKLLSDQSEQIAKLTEQIKGIYEEQLKSLQESNWNSFLEGTREHFKDRQGELADLRSALKLNTDMVAFEKSLKQPEFKPAEGQKEIKNNQEEEAPAGSGKVVAYDPYKGVMY
jgi:hypothetical protein